jgi:hypothetical protein
VTYVFVSRYRPFFAVLVTVYSRAFSSGIETAWSVASRSRSTKLDPSVTMYCMSCTAGVSARG